MPSYKYVNMLCLHISLLVAVFVFSENEAAVHSILITGSNRGIGLELVKQILVHPTLQPEILIATTRSAFSSKDLKFLAAQDKRLHILELDLNNYDAYPRLVFEVSKVVGEKGLTILFNNAGMLFSRHGKLTDVVDARMLLMQYNINALAPILLTKAALNMAARTITKEVKDDGIAVLVLHPGWVKTNMGGLDALITAEESVQGLLKVIETLNETTNGGFFKYNGNPLPW